MCIQKDEPDSEKKSSHEPAGLDTSDCHRHEQVSSGQNENLGRQLQTLGTARSLLFIRCGETIRTQKIGRVRGKVTFTWREQVNGETNLP